MDVTSPCWQEIADSEFPWERDALAFVRDRLPDHEPYRAWSNFEFIADDGSINEVDLLALTPKGFYLVEIKSRPGTVEGDQGTWTWRHDGRIHTLDNPLLLANRKAKKLISLLRRQSAFKQKTAPFLQALVFLSHEAVDCRITEDLRDRVHLRDKGTGRDERPGIVAALMRHSAGAPVRTRPDRPIAKAVSRAMQEAGIRPSQRARRVGDYRLDELSLDRPYYQDWTASHSTIESDRARVRIYAVPPSASDDERTARQRAARREYEILRGIEHGGILAARGYTEHTRGPALIFEHRDGSQRFDHWIAERVATLDVDTRLHLLRQIAEIVHFAHGKQLVHRALSPQSILVVDPQAPQPRLQIFNWQTGARGAFDNGTSGLATSGATRLDAFVEEAAWIYMAPEAVTERGPAGEQLDVFSLGAIAYHLFSGRPPASSFIEMTERLREEQGLRISSVLDGVGESLQLLVQHATHPEVTTRLESVGDFLKELEHVEEEFTRPEERSLPDPIKARSGDDLGHGLVMKRRLGKGATALALLVERGGSEYVLKVALSAKHNDRLREEAEVLQRLRHQYIVELHEVLTFKDGQGGERVGLLMARAGEATLADRLRAEGRIHLELLERFGEDLLATIDWLEQQGVPHRDIKPENLGTAKIGNQLHLVLFDFSLARTPADNILAGTRDYVDPFLKLRKPPRWDTHAERFAAAMTLHRMAAGSLPCWGDGKSEPAVLDCEVTIDADVFEPAVREGMSAFFRKALRRDYEKRFDNAEEMLRAWRQLFPPAARPETDPGHRGETSEFLDLGKAGLDTVLSALDLSARGLNALERMSVSTVRDLLQFPLARVNRMRGVGSRTRKELTTLGRRLAERFPAAAATPKVSAEDDAEIPVGAEHASVDELQRQLLPAGRTEQAKRDIELVGALLGVQRDGPPVARWPTQSDVARALDVTLVAVNQAVVRARQRWNKVKALNRLRDDVVEIIEAHGNVMTARELARAVLVRRGSVQEEPLRGQYADACVRAAVEMERHLVAPRWIVRRLDGPAALLLARDATDASGEPCIDGQKLADYAQRLGRRADELAIADPLLSPARVSKALSAVPAPAGAAWPAPNRLIEFAAAVSRNAALSSRLELYPRRMAADRALRLALGALAGARSLTPEEIQKRVAGRYPEAETLPARPALDEMLQTAGSELRWESADGRGAYASPLRRFVTIGSATSLTRTTGGAPEITEAGIAEWGEADAFDQRLRRALENRTFLALSVSPRRLADAERALASAFAVDARSADELLIRHMKAAAAEAGADWQVILRADREPRGSADWANLMRLVGHRALPRVGAELAEAPRAVLLTNLGLLARYDQMAFLDGLRDAAGRADGPPGVWLLVPSDAQESRPLIDGKPVPVFTAAQWARIPGAWLAGQRSAEAQEQS